MKTNRLFLLFALIALFVSSAFGQRGGFGRGMGGAAQIKNPSMLLRRDDVKTDLNLTDDQKAKLTDLMTGMQEKFRSAFQPGGDRAAMQETMRKIMEDTTTQVNAILTPAQQARLKEIAYQMAGNQAATDADTAKALGITDDQKAKIDDLVKKQQEANQALQEKVQSGELDRSEVGPRRQKNSEVLNEEIGKILTDDQKAKLKAMGGKPFTKTDAPGPGGK